MRQYDSDAWSVAWTASCNSCDSLQTWRPSTSRNKYVVHCYWVILIVNFNLTNILLFWVRIFFFPAFYFFVSSWISLFFLAVTGSRFDIQPAGSETASIASLALLAVPRSQWNCAKDQTGYQSGVHLLNSPTLLLLFIVSHLCFETN